MSENRSSLQFTDDKKAKIRQAALNLMNELVESLIALEPEDKNSLAKMSDRSIAYAEKTMEYIQSDPQFLPPDVDAEEVVKDYDTFTYLRSMIRLLMPFIENVDDTATLAGSDVLKAVSAYYNTVREAAGRGVPRAQTIHEDLRQHFEAQRTRVKRSAPTS